ncbi:YqaA family protein [Pseudoalteromonas sp. YIC-656]|uniref:YqaA family protein n=1 Tax=Pseudoalteromonas pernae TaxID=3118054 RepID=UPI003242BA2D
MAYLSLLLSAFISATLLPGSSEVLLSTLLLTGEHVLLLLWFSATVGNVLGSCVNYALGTQVTRFADRKWFPVSKQAMDKAQAQFNRYGVFSLLFAWLPIIGDPLTVVGGIFRVPFGVFVLLVTVGKGLRYGAVIVMTLGLEALLTSAS